MDPSHTSEIRAVAAPLVGFELISFSWRLSRELELMKRDSGELAWFPPADYLNIFSIVVLVFAVFVLPTPDLNGEQLARKGLSLSLLLLAGYPFALAGHYRLFRIAVPRRRPYCTLQEALFVLATIAVASRFMISTHFFGSHQWLGWTLPIAFLWLVFAFAVSEFAQNKQRGRARWLLMPIALPAILIGKFAKAIDRALALGSAPIR